MLEHHVPPFLFHFISFIHHYKSVVDSSPKTQSWGGGIFFILFFNLSISFFLFGKVEGKKMGRRKEGERGGGGGGEICDM